MRNRLLERSKEEGRVRSRLPEFTKDEIESLKGSADFLGFNHYMGFLIRNRLPEEYNSKVPIDDLDGGYVIAMNPKCKQINPPKGWIFINPESFKKHLHYIRTEYGNPKVMITENGCMNHLDEELNDVTRIEFLRVHLVALAQGKDVILRN
uniref:Beta-glucosidase n=1 Tax=Acrobeloides nanus TaxID=290746 RepID=A0A914DKY1_9BILA